MDRHRKSICDLSLCWSVNFQIDIFSFAIWIFIFIFGPGDSSIFSVRILVLIQPFFHRNQWDKAFYFSIFFCCTPLEATCHQVLPTALKFAIYSITSGFLSLAWVPVFPPCLIMLLYFNNTFKVPLDPYAGPGLALMSLPHSHPLPYSIILKGLSAFMGSFFQFSKMDHSLLLFLQEWPRWYHSLAFNEPSIAVKPPFG